MKIIRELQTINPKWTSLYFLMDDIKAYMDNIYKDNAGYVGDSEIDSVLTYIKEKLEIE